jgi:hypothetical protein
MPARTPAPLQDDERGFIKEVVERFYGSDAVVRNYGPDPNQLELHVEADAGPDMRKYGCLGVLLTRIDRHQVSLEVTRARHEGAGERQSGIPARSNPLTSAVHQLVTFVSEKPTSAAARLKAPNCERRRCLAA